jgi:hypothetical protein
MNTDNTRDAAEPSLASAGSHVALHRAVRALLEGVNARYEKNPREWTCPHMQALDDMTQSEPQPTLTDEERALLVRLGSDIREWDKYSSGRPWFVTVEDAAIIRGILERLG